MPPKSHPKGKTAVTTVIVQRPKKKSNNNGNNSKGTSGSIGRRIGSGIGGFVGDLAQKAIQTITGFGDYTVSSNSLYEGAMRGQGPPSFSQRTGKGGTIFNFRHREYIGDLSSTGANFNLRQYAISPANAELFPWLSICADNFDQYVFRGLVFEFKTNSATAVASTNTALGTVIMATQYNSYDQPFISKIEMEQYEYVVSTVPSQSCIHPIECAPSSMPTDSLYVDQTSAGGDLRFSRLGVFNVATVGQQAASNLGELWVSYDVDFMKPRMSKTAVQITGGGQYFRNTTPSGSTPTAELYGTTSDTYNDPDSSIAVRFGSVSTSSGGGLPVNSISFRALPVGQYMYQIFMAGTAANVGSPVPVIDSNYSSGQANLYTNYLVGSTAYTVVPQGVVNSTVIFTVVFQVTYPGDIVVRWNSISGYLSPRGQTLLLTSVGN